MHITISFAALLIGFMCNAISFAASFDCDKATTPTEKAICADSQLSALDEQLLQSYKPGRVGTAHLDRPIWWLGWAMPIPHICADQPPPALRATPP